MKSKRVAKVSHYTGPVRIITVREVSTYLRVHPSTIYRMLKHHQPPALHVGSDWRFNFGTDRQLALRAKARRLIQGPSPLEALGLRC
jgi:excisionase family DNA binding protein